MAQKKACRDRQAFLYLHFSKRGANASHGIPCKRFATTRPYGNLNLSFLVVAAKKKILFIKSKN